MGLLRWASMNVVCHKGACFLYSERESILLHASAFNLQPQPTSRSQYE
jgi:hypothetical protein